MASPKCEHATKTTRCCAGCATLRSAEALLLEVQRARPPEAPVQAFPRSPVELRILEALQQTAPRAVTANRIATLLGLPRQEAQTILHALALLRTIRVSEKGYYRSQPI